MIENNDFSEVLMFKLEGVVGGSKEEFYENLISFAEGLMYNERDMIANLANVSALLFNTMTGVNWAGFYLMKDDELVLGPFQGKPACIRIQVGRGVCGTAASMRITQVVKNVHEFEGHIACDGDTLSEIVIPIIVNDKVVGVLDIDSPELERFDNIDNERLNQLVDRLVSGCDWKVGA